MSVYPINGHVSLYIRALNAMHVWRAQLIQPRGPCVRLSYTTTVTIFDCVPYFSSSLAFSYYINIALVRKRNTNNKMCVFYIYATNPKILFFS